MLFGFTPCRSSLSEVHGSLSVEREWKVNFLQSFQIWMAPSIGNRCANWQLGHLWKSIRARAPQSAKRCSGQKKPADGHWLRTNRINPHGRWGHVAVSGALLSYKLLYIVGFWLVEMAISTNQKPTIYRNVYKTTSTVPQHCRAKPKGSNCSLDK